MRRKFFTNISLLIFLNILVKAFWVLGIDRTVQNVVGAESYGFYFSLFSFSILFSVLLDFGITNYNNRRVATNPSALPEILWNVFIIRLVFAIIYTIVTVVFAGVLGYNEEQRSLLNILIFNQFLVSFILYLRSNITALYLFRIDSFISVTDRFLMIIICSLLLWGNFTDNQFRIEWFVYSQTVSYSLTFIIAFVTVLNKGKIKRFKVNLNQVKIIIRGSAPFALLSMFMSVYWRVDSVMIERLLTDGLAKAGIYAQAFRLLDATSMIPFLFAIILLPMFSRIISQGKSISSILKFSTFLLLIPASATTIISLLYSSEIMELLYRGHVDESAIVFAILMTGYIPVSLVYIYSTFLTASGRMRTLNLIASGAMGLNILTNFLLIPKMGLIGSAIASAGTQFIMSVLYGTIVLKRENIEQRFHHLIRVGSYLLIMALLAIVLKAVNLSILPGIIIVSLFSIGLSMLFRAINPRDLLLFFDPNC